MLEEWFWAMFKLDLILIFVNISCELGWANNDQICMAFKNPEEWFWEMFEPTPIWYDFTFGQLVI